MGTPDTNQPDSEEVTLVETGYRLATEKELATQIRDIDGTIRIHRDKDGKTTYYIREPHIA